MQRFRKKLEKCRKSLQAHVSRGSTPASLRSMMLIDRYQGLRSEIIGNESALNEWAAYCRDHGMDFRHTAGDFFS
jgi:hypothetical protein